MDIELEKINERNRRVENDKAWEVSKTRRVIIALFTYIVACFFLNSIGNESPYINAFVPTFGYLLSTLSLPSLKKLWIAKYGSK